MKLIKKRDKSVAPAVYNTLSDVMDKTRPFYIIYSGVEQETYFNILYDCGVRNFLMSYHYIQNKHISFQSTYGDKGIKFFIDSGAHTYQQDPKYADYGVDFWEEHLKKYLNWAEKNKEFIFAIANFDFEAIVGAETVKRWNEQYFEPFMLRTGIPVCFVWHQISYSDWEFYCKRYPYVGFSSVNVESNEAITLPEYTEKLKTAEKYDTLVHGFGMTKTSMLTSVPFYTSDSTTWLVGLQYGEINYWNGTKMSRLKKDKWKGAFADTICDKYRLDKAKFLDEDVTEVIKANVGAFMDAEEFIQQRLRSQMYWLKRKAIRVDIDNLPDDFFPDEEWFANTPTTDPLVKGYAQKMNINPESEEVYNIVYDMTMFLNWDSEEFETRREEYLEDDGQLITELHDRFINRIVPDLDAKIEDLQNFYRECLSGERDTLLQLGTNFDRVMKERDSYIEEEDGEYVDIDPDEVRERVHSLVEMSEDDEGEAEFEKLDKEIFEKAQIVPVFSEDGKFVKGQIYRRKPKKIYSAKYPKIACDTCMSAAKCPEYKAGYVCAYSKMFERFSTRDMGDVIEAMQGMVDYNLSRMQKEMVNEVLSGVSSGTVTALMNQNMQMLNLLKQMYEAGNPEVLRHTSVIRADGTREETTQVTNPQSGGILEKIFGGMGSTTKEPEEKVVETEGSTITMNTELTDGDKERKDEDE